MKLIRNIVRLALASVLLMVAKPVYGQIAVESFRLLENDLAANTQGTMKLDQNGDVAAIIRVVTTEKGFTFDGGMMGIVATVQDVGEILVYVPHGLQKITVKHATLGILRDYYFPIPIEEARTYELKLISGTVRTIIEDKITAQYVVFNVSPRTATVYIDDTPYQLATDSTLSKLLPYGRHTYRVEAPDYQSEQGELNVGSEKLIRQVTLKSSLSTITIECQMADAELYLDDRKIGEGRWSGTLAPGMYKLDVKREGHRPRTMSFNVNPLQNKTITAPVPQPVYGSVSITSDPNQSKVILDGKEIGETPLLQGNILVGQHSLEITKAGYGSYKSEVEIKEGELAELSATLVNVFNARFTSTPSGANLSINGEIVGTTPFDKTLNTGDYDIKITKRGYSEFSKRMRLDVDNVTVDCHLRKMTLKKNNFYVGAGYKCLAAQGVQGTVGFYLGSLNIEGSYLLPIGMSQTAYIVTPAESAESSTSYWEYQYKLESCISASLGYGILIGNNFRLTPMVGASVYSIKGDGNKFEDSSMIIRDSVQATVPISAFGSVKMEYAFANSLAVFVTPSFSKPVALKPIAQSLEDGLGLVNKWCGGLSVSAGIMLEF